ncbi:MAG: MFS transporter [Cyanobacteria bacterium J06627_28]
MTRPWLSLQLTGLPQLRREIWILVAGQLFLFIGQGFTLVYASLFFVNQLGFSPTQVGLALSSSGFSGIFGRFFAGCAIDSRWMGRRRTLLLAALVSAMACFCLAYADTFGLLVAGNVLLGLGLSLYWPTTLAVIADLTIEDNRAEAFALSQLSNNLGLGLGALLAGQYIALAGSYRALFVAKGLVYLVFGLVIWRTIAETREKEIRLRQVAVNWGIALRDRTLITFLLANTFFAIYGAQLSSTLPLYLANFVPAASVEGNALGFSEQLISYLFFFHALVKIIAQLPITRWVKQIDHVAILLFTLVLWAGSAAFFWLAGIVAVGPVLEIAIAAFFLVALAEILYGPAASALTGDLAPADQRGIYFALESECWAIGFLLGPALGGWALDHPLQVGANLWLVLVASTALPGAILLFLRQLTASDNVDTSAT